MWRITPCYKKDEKSVLREARKHLYAIAADYSETLVRMWLKVLTWLWNNIYDGLVVDQEGLVKLRIFQKDAVCYSFPAIVPTSTI